jgi:hypothetical protein
MHNECNEGKGTECAVGQVTIFIPQPVHHSLATQHENHDGCNILFQLHITDPHRETCFSDEATFQEMPTNKNVLSWQQKIKGSPKTSKVLTQSECLVCHYLLVSLDHTSSQMKCTSADIKVISQDYGVGKLPL